MRNITIGDLLLVLDDLYTNKINLVQATLAFQLYGDSLSEKREKLSSIQTGLEKKPLVEALKEADLVHDTSARAVYYICAGLEQLSTLDPEVKVLLTKIQERFVPNLSDLNRSYEDEAVLAKRRVTDLETMKPELEAFPIGPLTLYSLLHAHLNAGKQLDTLLSSRAETTADDEANRTKDVFILRSQALGLLTQFRSALSQEIAVNQSLPRDLEAKVFSYFDQLSQNRSARFSGKQSGTTEPAPTEFDLTSEPEPAPAVNE